MLDNIRFAALQAIHEQHINDINSDKVDLMKSRLAKQHRKFVAKAQAQNEESVPVDLDQILDPNSDSDSDMDMDRLDDSQYDEFDDPPYTCDDEERAAYLLALEKEIQFKLERNRALNQFSASSLAHHTICIGSNRVTVK